MKTRILLASMVFDLGIAPNHMYTPVINWFFDFTDKDKPIVLQIKYAWQDSEIKYPFNDAAKKLFVDGGLVNFSRSVFKDNRQYDGDLLIDMNDEFYVSSKGREIGFVKDFDTACKLYQNLTVAPC